MTESTAEIVRIQHWRKTGIVIRCPHCGKVQRLIIALIQTEDEEE
jgi:uncharacterized Zn finger protein